MDAAKVKLPPFLPDAPEVRSDILDYLFEVERFDTDMGKIIAAIEQLGELENTIVVVTSDNGLPFPRCKTNLYDYGARMPLVVHWPAVLPRGRVVEDFVNHIDLAPTFLEAAGLPVPDTMRGRSLMNVLRTESEGQVDAGRDRAIFGRERHTLAHEGKYGYPCRALRTRDFLYIRNFKAERPAAGDAPNYSDVDRGSPTKDYMLVHRNDPDMQTLFDHSFGVRPPEELYDLAKDPDQMNNVAGQLEYEAIRARLWGELEDYLRRTGDPRVLSASPPFDDYAYYGGAWLKDALPTPATPDAG